MLYKQDEWHVIFQCCHPDIRALQAHFECLFDVCVLLKSYIYLRTTEKLHLFVNQPDVVEVAKFVWQLQISVEHFMEGCTYD